MFLSCCSNSKRKLHGGSTTLKGKRDLFHTAHVPHFFPLTHQERDGALYIQNQQIAQWSRAQGVDGLLRRNRIILMCSN